MSKSLPDLSIERLALGELSPPESARVRAALGDEADATLAALAADDAAILREHPPAQVAAEVQRRLARREREAAAPRPTGARWWIPAGALVAAGAAAWWLARGPLPNQVPVDGGDGGEGVVAVSGGDELPELTRIKGDPVLTIDRMAAGRSERLRDGATVHAGDRLQLQYGAAEREQGAIVSIDGRGAVTLHFPDDAAASPRLADGGLVALDHSYELDDAPQFERFFFVTVPRGRSLSVAAVMAAAQQLARTPAAMQQRLTLPSGYEQVAITLHKSR
ncbi:MAG: hypothetical protein U0168_00160 [Nannocystaceae bacterium]